MKKIIYLLVIVLTLTACKGSKVPQAPLDDEDSLEVVVEENVDTEGGESNEGYVNLGNVECKYFDETSKELKEYYNAVLYAKVLSNNSVYYYVSLKKGGKKYTVMKSDPAEYWGYNGRFVANYVGYLVYIQSWDNTNSQNVNTESNNGTSNNTQTTEESKLRVVQKWQNCGGCGGSGSCGTCKGSGQNPYKMDGYEECPQCHGMRKCQFCGGRGGYYYEVLE